MLNHIKKEKPPLGIMPKWRWDELNNIFSLDALIYRYIDFQDTISRYQDARKNIPNEWIAEICDLHKKINHELRWATDPLNILRRLPSEEKFGLSPVFNGRYGWISISQWDALKPEGGQFSDDGFARVDEFTDVDGTIFVLLQIDGDTP